MERAPDLVAFDQMAQDAFADLPADFRRLCGNVVIHVAEEAAPDVLKDLNISDPLELSGLFEGVAITQASVTDPIAAPNHIHLYRRSILAELRERGNITLETLIAHVLVHEIGHHFGLSDEDMHRIEKTSHD
ncbi:MAG: metallopeptidase family protein [Pseudomonadota bacterium]